MDQRTFDSYEFALYCAALVNAVPALEALVRAAEAQHVYHEIVRTKTLPVYAEPVPLADCENPTCRALAELDKALA